MPNFIKPLKGFEMNDTSEWGRPASRAWINLDNIVAITWRDDASRSWDAISKEPYYVITFTSSDRMNTSWAFENKEDRDMHLRYVSDVVSRSHNQVERNDEGLQIAL